jgi:hypothetical protein
LFRTAIQPEIQLSTNTVDNMTNEMGKKTWFRSGHRIISSFVVSKGTTSASNVSHRAQTTPPQDTA